MSELNEVKVLRDPIHGYIHIKDKIIWDCLNSKEFQRLRRIHQLGATFEVYHTAEHSRFSHSLGVYEIARRIVEENEDFSVALTQQEKISVMVAALLHDLGHGPFSHAFEKLTSKSHEAYTAQIIMGPSQVHDILAEYDPNLPAQVVSIINHTAENQLLSQVISSQLDADRMDYLLRDAYFSGTSYGQFDLERILRTIRVKEGKLVVKQSGIHTVEDYIMARYHMYWQVYYHPVNRSYEAILNNLFKRMQVIYNIDPSGFDEYPMFKGILEEKPLTNDELYELDECSFQYGFMQLRKHPDPIIADLADRLVNRKLFAYENVTTIEQTNQYYEWISSHGYDSDYYMYIDKTDQRPYQPYKNDESSIWILMDDGKILELADASKIVFAVMNTNEDQKKVYFPKELNE